MITGSAFHVAAVFPYFELPGTAKDTLTTLDQKSEAGNEYLGRFCKGCGNRMIHDSEEHKNFITCSAVRTKGVDIKAVLGDKLTPHFWTSKAVVPSVFWEGCEFVYEGEPDEQAKKDFAEKLEAARKV